MTRPRVVVTGDGAISALGRTVAESMAALYAGRVPPPGLAPRAEVPAPSPVFAVPGDVDEASAALRGRTARLALHAVDEALAATPIPAIDPLRIGVCLGTTVGCTFNDEPFYRAFRRGERPEPGPVRRYLAGDLADVVAARAGALGPRATVVNACASGTDAIGIAAGWVRSGRCDVAIAGGADELARYPYLGFHSLGNVARERCRPFDKERQGLNLGEGAGVVILEREEDARRRGARVLGVIAGYGAAADAHHPTAPHPEGRGLRQAIAAALAAAGLPPEAIGFVNAHGTATPDNDRVEGRVLAALLPGAAVVATKGYTGHTLGAAGALEAIFTIHNLLDGRVPASGGFATPDPECAVTPTRTTMDLAARAALSTSLAFGGANAVLAFERGEGR